MQAGTPLNVLRELGGWSTYGIVLKYAHLSAGHLAEHAEKIHVSCTLSGTPECMGHSVPGIHHSALLAASVIARNFR